MDYLAEAASDASGKQALKAIAKDYVHKPYGQYGPDAFAGFPGLGGAAFVDYKLSEKYKNTVSFTHEARLNWRVWWKDYGYRTIVVGMANGATGWAWAEHLDAWAEDAEARGGEGPERWWVVTIGRELKLGLSELDAD